MIKSKVEKNIQLFFLFGISVYLSQNIFSYIMTLKPKFALDFVIDYSSNCQESHRREKKIRDNFF